MPDNMHIALTFDDGPNMSTTLQVYDVLERFNVKATFFLCGSKINHKTSLVIKHAVSSGYEICNHSMHHKDLLKLSDDKIHQEIDETDKRISQITGTTPRFFRAPFIHVSEHLYSIVDKVFIEGIACNDWLDSVSTVERAGIILDKVRDGDIILMHDAEGNFKTVEALNIIIPTLINRGYKFCTLSELFDCYGINPEPHSGILYSNVFQTKA